MTVVYAAGFEPYPWLPAGTVTIDTTWNPEPSLEAVAEARLVAEVLRRVLAGEISDKSRELLEFALQRCEEAAGA